MTAPLDQDALTAPLDALDTGEAVPLVGTHRFGRRLRVWLPARVAVRLQATAAPPDTAASVVFLTALRRRFAILGIPMDAR